MRNLKALALGLFLSLAGITGAAAQCGTQAPANKFCGNDTGSPALATWKTVPPGALTPIAGGTVLGNRGTSAAAPTPLTNPVLGIPGTSTGEVGLAGTISGTAVLRAQAVAGSAVSLLPTAAGTLVGTATSPLAINATTGLITCATCVTSSGGGAITGTAPISVSAAGVVSINAPYVSLTASNGGIVYSGATNLAILAGTATARQMLQSGASTTPAWSTTTWPATSTINRILYSSAANVVGEITTANGGLLNTSSSGVPSITPTPVLGVAGATVGSLGFQNATSGTATLQPVTGALGTVTVLIPSASGTMAVSASSPLSLNATTGALTCSTCVTLAGAETLTNKVIQSNTNTLGGVSVLMGSDATGDIYYRNSSGILTRLGIGSATNVLTVSGGLPAWTAAAGGGNVSNSGTPTINQIAQWTNATTIQGVNLSSLLTAGAGISLSGTTTVTITNGMVVTKQPFTGSGTYTPTTGMAYAIIECVGSGGGGGGTTGTVNNLFTAGGGGGGSYSRVVVTAATVGASQSVTVGNAGTGGSTGSNNGTAGGDVSVGTLCVGKGGSAGGFSAAGTFGIGGAGGVAGTGDFTFPGQAGAPGIIGASTASIFATGGNGGGSYFGAGGIQSTPVSAASSNGVAGSNYGAGGSGGQSHNIGTTSAGGNGSKGAVFITEFVKP